MSTVVGYVSAGQEVTDAHAREHVVALARVLCGDGFSEERAYCETHRYGGWHQCCCKEGRDTAESILAAIATDPAVQNAVLAALPTETMLAALVERGALVEEEELVPCPSRHYERDLFGDWCDEACRSFAGHDGDHECVSGRTWPRTSDDPKRRVMFVEPEWRAKSCSSSPNGGRRRDRR